MSNAVRWVVVALVSVHGGIHLLGAAKGLRWAQVSQLKEPIGSTAGLFWLAAAVLVVTAAVLIAVGKPDWWWAVALLAALSSQALIFTAWGDAKAGTAANVVLLLAAVYGFAALGPTSYRAEWNTRTANALKELSASQGRPGRTNVITDEDLMRLPEPVGRYVRAAGAIGSPHVSSFSATLHGRIRSGPNKPWMPFTGRQLNTYGDHPRRYFWIDAEMHGLPVTVFHAYEDHATMRGKILSLIPILDVSGPKMDQGETVTVLNDIAVMAPAALLQDAIRWTPIDSHHARATYTAGTQTVSADLVFDDNGKLVDFVSDDRYRTSEDGTTATRTRWNTPISEYRTMHGHRVASYGEGMWVAPAPEGHFTYIEFHIDDLNYNVAYGRSDQAHPETGGISPRGTMMASSFPRVQ